MKILYVMISAPVPRTDKLFLLKRKQMLSEQEKPWKKKIYYKGKARETGAPRWEGEGVRENPLQGTRQISQVSSVELVPAWRQAGRSDKSNPTV
jgi:hypothetical protein